MLHTLRVETLLHYGMSLIGGREILGSLLTIPETSLTTQIHILLKMPLWFRRLRKNTILLCEPELLTQMFLLTIGKTQSHRHKITSSFLTITDQRLKMFHSTLLMLKLLPNRFRTIILHTITM